MNKKLGKAKPFENMEDAFDLPPIMDTDPLDFDDSDGEEEKKINTKIIVPPPSTVVRKPVLGDEDYIRFKMMELIESSTRVLEKLESEIKIGTGDRTFEVYSELADSVNKQLSELVNMNDKVEKIKLERKKLRLKEKSITVDSFTSSNKIAMTASQINALLKDATEKSELKKIDANFKIESYSDKDEHDE